MSPSTPVFTLHPDTRVMVAGARGLVGNAVVRKLRERGIETILQPTSSELDLTDRNSVFSYLSTHTPDIIVDAAAKVSF